MFDTIKDTIRLLFFVRLQLLTMSNIEDLAKQAMDGLDEDVVPKATKRTSEEVTTFKRLRWTKMNLKRRLN